MLINGVSLHYYLLGIHTKPLKRMDVIMETLAMPLLFAKLIKTQGGMKFAYNLISQVSTILKLAEFGTRRECGLLL